MTDEEKGMDSGIEFRYDRMKRKALRQAQGEDGSRPFDTTAAPSLRDPGWQKARKGVDSGSVYLLNIQKSE